MHSTPLAEDLLKTLLYDFLGENCDVVEALETLNELSRGSEDTNALNTGWESLKSHLATATESMMTLASYVDKLNNTSDSLNKGEQHDS